MQSIKMIIAGGRNVHLSDRQFGFLDGVRDGLLAQGIEISEVISGGASGVDCDGESWASHHGVPVRIFKPDWNMRGKAAGPIRNAAMAHHAGHDGICILFPGGSGTASMFEEANKVGMKVIDRRNPNK